MPDQDNQEQKENEEPVNVSSKKVIYAEIDDEVTAVYDKLKPLKTRNIYIVVPKRAVFFQSIVNLKILKRKAENDGKTIYLITNDKNGIYLAQQLGIIVYDKPNNEGKPSLFSAESQDEKLRITPLKASVNSVEEEAPIKRAEKKISISEILKLKRGNKKVTISKVTQNENKPQEKEKSKFVLVAPNRHVLISLIAVSVIILLVVVYIALPGATIYLTPSASVLEQSVNITLADFQKNKAELDMHPSHTIAFYPVDTTIQKTITYNSTGKKFSEKGANSSGKLTIVNTSNAVWPLVAKTRFQTQTGLVFRITDGVNVPAATSQGFGKLEVFVTADPLDAYEQIIGERGNIPASKFFLPGLTESSRSSLYGESYAPMTGGVTDFITYVSPEDMIASKARMNDELVKTATEELRKAVQQKIELSGVKGEFVLLEGEGAVKLNDPTIQIPDVEGQEVSEFVVRGEVYVSGVYYDRAAMLSILESELKLKKSPQKELLKINEESTSYRIYEWDEATGKIKLTANIKGIEQYEIDPEKENGANLLQKIRDHVAGKDVEEAKQYIQNLPEINKVEIDSWPMWSPTIPNLSDNIKFEIRDAKMVE